MLTLPNFFVLSAESLLSAIPPQEPRENEIWVISVTSITEQRDVCRPAAFCSRKLAYGKDKEDSPSSQFVMLLLGTLLKIRLTALEQLKRSNVKIVQWLLKFPRKAYAPSQSSLSPTFNTSSYFSQRRAAAMALTWVFQHICADDRSFGRY